MTYNVVGNFNEWGVMIGESTFGGVEALSGKRTDSVVDYGMMIWAVLQRSKPAREAIYVMDELATKYGYASTGESFDIGDPNEVWLLEFVGKGKEKGAVWVASRVPDGYITATGNQARTHTISFNDPEKCIVRRRRGRLRKRRKDCIPKMASQSTSPSQRPTPH